MKLAKALRMPFVALIFASQALALGPMPQGGALVFEDEAAAHTRGQGSAGPSEREPLSFVAHIPGAKTHAAPDWVKPGMRMTIWMGTASVNDSSSMETVVEDPNGNLVDSSGKRYRQSTSGGFTDTGAAGAGYIQVDVIHSSSVGVKLDIRNYTGDGTYNAPQVQMVEGALVNGGSCEYWIHPALLAQVKPGSNATSSIMKGPWKVGGQTYQAVIFVQKSATSKQSIAYDMVSGVALTQSALYRSTSKHTGYDPNTGRTRGGNSQHKNMMESRFVGIRNLNLPWASDPFSPKANQFKTARFTGQMSMEPSHGAPASMQEDRMRVGRSEPGCLGIATKKLFPGMDPAKAPEFPRYTAVHQIGGFLMNPAALRKLRQGQVIDQDPHTKIRIHVEYVGPSNSGNQIVGILEEGAGSSLRWVYDVESGELYGYATIIPYGPGMTSVSQYNRQ